MINKWFFLQFSIKVHLSVVKPNFKFRLPVVIVMQLLFCTTNLKDVRHRLQVKINKPNDKLCGTYLIAHTHSHTHTHAHAHHSFTCWKPMLILCPRFVSKNSRNMQHHHMLPATSAQVYPLYHYLCNLYSVFTNWSTYTHTHTCSTLSHFLAYS